MKLKLMAIPCLTLCLTACETIRVAENIEIPADKIDCVAAGERPKIPAEYVIDWNSVQTVQTARSEHDAYVRTVRDREGVIGGHIVDIEGKLFACSSDDKWIRDYQAGLRH